MNTFKGRTQEPPESKKHMELYQEIVIAAKNQSNILALFCYTGTCNAQLFNAWLEQILVPERKPGQVVILDNASFHKSKENLEIIEKAGFIFASLLS